MIQKYSFDQIDLTRYDACILNSAQRKYSADSTFLRCVAGNKWDVLVLDDCRAVMPVTYIKRFGFKIVVAPPLCQQLGVFSESDSEIINQMFLDCLKKNYRVLYYPFNDANQFSQPLHQRKNYLIKPASYETVYKKYSPKRKRKLRLNEGVAEFSEVRSVMLSAAENFILANLKGVKKPALYLNLFRNFENTGRLEIFGFYWKNRLTNLIALYHDSETVALLGSINDLAFIKNNGAPYLVDFAIRKYVESKTFDFEGGNIPAIEEFFTGFRPQLKPFSVIQNSKRSLFSQMLK